MPKIVMKNGLNFLVILKRESGKKFTKQSEKQIRTMLESVFGNVWSAGDAVFVCGGLDDDLMKMISAEDDAIEAAAKMMDKVNQLILTRLGVEDAQGSISIFAPLALTISAMKSCRKPMFNEMRDMFNETGDLERQGDAAEKTRADQWLDGILEEMSNGGKEEDEND